MNTHKIFVYGTLKKSYNAYGLMRDQNFISEARTTNQYRLYDCGSFPGLKSDLNGYEVEGELWEIDDNCLKRLDNYEGYPTLYNRKKINLSSHPSEDVIAYFIQIDTKKLKDNGPCWKPSQE